MSNIEDSNTYDTFDFSNFDAFNIEEIIEEMQLLYLSPDYSCQSFVIAASPLCYWNLVLLILEVCVWCKLSP